MIIKENANDVLKNFVESEKVIRIYDALKVGLEKDNLVIIDTFLQNLLNQLFLEVAKTVELEDSDIKDNNPKSETIDTLDTKPMINVANTNIEPDTNIVVILLVKAFFIAIFLSYVLLLIM